MKIKFLATAKSPVRYEFDVESILSFETYVPPPEVIEGEDPPPEPDPEAPEPETSIAEIFDLSLLAHGDQFEGVEPAVLSLPGSQVIRHAERDEFGELHVTLCQSTRGGGTWLESDWMDSADYEPGKQYIYKQGQVNPLAPEPEPIEPEPDPEEPA